ncbi:hypothetical protein [Pseudoalteromonas sp. A25]|nr:hypothetical protein [Pseudoalteromonas sp. A25]
MMQLIARGYFDYHELKPVYKSIFWTSNLIGVVAISIYPVRQILVYFKK